jgi:CDP-6-deoxy-D-xylo-4-hexulose-3-dehydrase
MVSSNIEEIVKLARSYATWGRDCHCVGTCNLLPNGTCNNRFSNWLSDFPETIIDHKYVFNRIGYNLKPLDLQAAIGLEQLKKLDYICEKRKENREKISHLFCSHVPVRTVTRFGVTDWCPFGVPIICQNKEQKQKLVSYLEKNGVQTRNYFAGNLLMHPGYKHLDNYLKYPEANKVLDLVFFVGCAPTISKENIKYIEKVLQERPKNLC